MINNNKWNKIGEMNRDGTWYKVFEMTFKNNSDKVVSN